VGIKEKMNKSVTLRGFGESELILGEDQTREVLKFFFATSADHKLIDSLTVSTALRAFTQGLLVEAIDASYAMGFVEILFRSVSNSTKNALKIIKDFGKRAAKHWFKHATARDLFDVKVYESVRVSLGRSFKTRLVEYSEGIARNPRGQDFAFVTFPNPAKSERAWG
jgi:hypothetical protein